MNLWIEILNTEKARELSCRAQIAAPCAGNGAGLPGKRRRKRRL